MKSGKVLAMFDKSRASPTLTVSLDGLSVRRSRGAKCTHQCGVAFGDAPLPRFGVNGDESYFEVYVDETCDGSEKGLVLGVTTVLLEHWQEQPDIAVDVASAWSLGYEGLACLCNRSDFMTIPWRPKGLHVGDRVGLWVSASGEIKVYVNDKAKARTLGPISQDTPLYGFVDLLGNTVAVSLRPGVSPPGVSTLARFNAKLISEFVAISPDGRSVRHDHSTQLGGVVYGDAPIIRFGRHARAYFEVRVDEVRDTCPDGLVLGVTVARPQRTAVVADEVQQSWSLGYDGNAHVRDKDDMCPIKWQPWNLREGDHVGLLVTEHGDLVLFENGIEQDRLSIAIPTNVPLYAFVDLLGNTLAVSLVVDSQPPDDI